MCASQCCTGSISESTCYLLGDRRFTLLLQLPSAIFSSHKHFFYSSCLHDTQQWLHWFSCVCHPTTCARWGACSRAVTTLPRLYHFKPYYAHCAHAELLPKATRNEEICVLTLFWHKQLQYCCINTKGKAFSFLIATWDTTWSTWHKI